MTDLTQKEIENRRNALRAARREEQMECRVTGTTFRRGDGRYVSAEGIARLAETGVASFEEATGHHLPHNLVRTAMSGAVGVVGPDGCALSQEGAAQQIKSHARMGGWLAAAAELPAVRKLIEKTQSSRGINSDYTYVSLWNLVERFPSPGHLERKLWLVKRRAEAILGAYEGQKPSWCSLGEALMADARVGKAAIIAAAINLGWGGEPSHDPKTGEYAGLQAQAGGYGRSSGTYQRARNWLAECRSAAFHVVREDGVRVTAAPIYTKMGAEVFGALRVGQYGQRKLLYFVRFGGRERLVERGEARLRSPSTGYWTTVVHGPRAAILNALSAWRTHERETVPVMRECEEVRVISARKSENVPYNGSFYRFTYEVDLSLGERRGRFSVANTGSYRDEYQVEEGSLFDADAEKLFEVASAAASSGDMPDGPAVMALLGHSEQTMEALGFRKEPSDEPEV